MALDLTTLSPQEWFGYLRIGKRHPTALLQANATLGALSTHAKALVDHGFSSEDAQQLAEARDLRILAGVGRVEKAGERTVSSRVYEAALDEAKAARLQARSIASRTRTVLVARGEVEAATELQVVLDQTNKATEDVEKLTVQLDTLATALVPATVVEVAKTRGGEAAKIRLSQAAQALRQAELERNGKGTRFTTEQLHVINGIIVTLARQANASARAAARALKTPALAKAFVLAELYPKKASAKSDGEAQAKGRGKGKGKKGKAAAPAAVAAPVAAAAPAAVAAAAPGTETVPATAAPPASPSETAAPVNAPDAAGG